MRSIATVLLLVATWATGSAQVPVGKEPHHRVVFEDDRLRVLDVNIPPGATTLEHSHDHDLVTVSIGQADTRTRAPGADWGAVRPRRPLGDVSATEYAGQPGVHTIQNVGSDLYHLIAVENLRQSGWQTTPAVGAPGLRAAVESRAFRAWSIELDPSRPSVTRALASPSVVVLVVGEVVLTRKSHEQKRLTPGARWSVVGAGEEYTLSSRGGSARLVEIEVR